MAAGEIRCLLSGQDEAKQVERANDSVAQLDITSVEVTIDLEPILAELGDLSPIDEMSITAREALTAKLERIRAECFQHPVGQAWIKQIDTEVQQVIKRVIEEALVHKLDEYLGFARYERTEAAKPAHQHRSSTWGRSLRTMWGDPEIRVPKLRQGYKERSWQVLVRYERNFSPHTGAITPLGLAFANYMSSRFTPYVDLVSAAIYVTPRQPLTPDGQSAKAIFRAVVRNAGNTDVHDVTIQFWTGDPGMPHGSPRVIPTLAARSWVSVRDQWLNVPVGEHVVGITVDDGNSFVESDEGNNQLSRRFLVVENGVYLPLVL